MNLTKPKTAIAASPAPCPACGQSTNGATVEVPDHEYGLTRRAIFAKCSSCLSEYQSPMPADSELSGFYPATYHAMTIEGWLMRKRREMRLSRLRTVLAGKSGAILDYGCGNGAFLYLAAKKMPENIYFGFEYSEKLEINQSNDKKVTIVKGTIKDLLQILPSCQVLIMNHVIEHLPNPYEVLCALFEKLAPGGVFDGQTPNSDSLEHRLFGKRWSGYHAPRHTVVFSKKGLERLFERVGFKESLIEGAFNPAGFAVSLASLPHGDRQGMIVRKGVTWHLVIAIACLLLPFDLASGAPGMVNFLSRKAK